MANRIDNYLLIEGQGLEFWAKHLALTVGRRVDESYELMSLSDNKATLWFESKHCSAADIIEPIARRFPKHKFVLSADNPTICERYHYVWEDGVNTTRQVSDMRDEVGEI